MADTVGVHVISEYDLSGHCVIHLVALSDGTGESNVVKVDRSTLLAADGGEPASLDLIEARWSIQGFDRVTLSWDYTSGGTISGIPASTSVNLALIDTQLNNLTSTQLSLLTEAQLGTLTSAQLASLAMTQLNGLTAAQLSSLAGTQLDGLTSWQLASLAATQLDGIRSGQLASLASTQLAGLGVAQLAAMSNPVMMHLCGSGYEQYHNMRGPYWLPDPRQAGGTGDVLLTSAGAVSGASYDITLVFRKATD